MRIISITLSVCSNRHKIRALFDSHEMNSLAVERKLTEATLLCFPRKYLKKLMSASLPASRTTSWLTIDTVPSTIFERKENKAIDGKVQGISFSSFGRIPNKYLILNTDLSKISTANICATKNLILSVNIQSYKNDKKVAKFK